MVPMKQNRVFGKKEQFGDLLVGLPS